MASAESRAGLFSCRRGGRIRPPAKRSERGQWLHRGRSEVTARKAGPRRMVRGYVIFCKSPRAGRSFEAHGIGRVGSGRYTKVRPWLQVRY